MTHRLLRTPGALAARGAAALAFGTLTLAWPAMTVAAFVRLFAALAVCDGVAVMAVQTRYRRRGRDATAARDPRFLLGAGGAALGATAALWPDLSMRALLTLVAVWALGTALGHLHAATRARPRPAGWPLLAGAGAAGLALAASIVVALAVGEVRVGWSVGLYGLVAGALLLACAWRLQAALARQPRRRAGDAPTIDADADTDAENADADAGAAGAVYGAPAGGAAGAGAT
jgi:uncharacterized membrane protein HdeD (DUF308 family)